jgi:hypothetical protein
MLDGLSYSIRSLDIMAPSKINIGRSGHPVTSEIRARRRAASVAAAEYAAALDWLRAPAANPPP